MSTGRADFRTVVLLALRHTAVRRVRGVFLLVGYAVGAAVMMVLLSVGEAMLTQARDVSLVGGGDVLVLPEGIDLEGLRTGSGGGFSQGIDRARFVERQMVGGRRLAGVAGPTSPVIEHKLLYLRDGDRLVPLRVGGEIPSAARAAGAGLDILQGAWQDEPADEAFRSPTPEQLLNELDHFHTPAPDPSWAEWHYFNVAAGRDEWWHITFMFGRGESPGQSRDGKVLVTRHRGGRSAHFESISDPGEVRINTVTADLTFGANTVRQREGVYEIRAEAIGRDGALRVALEVRPGTNAYVPPLERRAGRFVSGYVVPVMRGTATGTICENGRCQKIDAAAYHDHNWGVWAGTAWNWGQAQGSWSGLVYGGVIPPDSVALAGPGYFIALADSLGLRRILRFESLQWEGAQPTSLAGVVAPTRMTIVAGRGNDTLRLSARMVHVQATPNAMAGGGRVFLQMRGEYSIAGMLGGEPVADSGRGFFETFVRRDNSSRSPAKFQP